MGQIIDGRKAKKLVDKGAILVDVRNAVAFRDSAIDGAINVPLRRVSSLFVHPKTTKFIICGESASDSDVLSTITYLITYQYTNVYNLGSVSNWSSKP